LRFSLSVALQNFSTGKRIAGRRVSRASAFQVVPRQHRFPGSPTRHAGGGAGVGAMVGEKAPPPYTCKVCKKTFTHAPAHVQHERAHMATGAPSPDAAGKGAAAPPAGWLREVKPHKDPNKPGTVVYKQQLAPEGGGKPVVLRSAADAERWLAAQEGSALPAMSDFDFTAPAATKADDEATGKEQADAEGVAGGDKNEPMPDKKSPPPEKVQLQRTRSRARA